MRRRQRLIMIAGLLCLAGMSQPGWAETDGAVESRALRLPRVTVPPPPPPLAMQQLAVRTTGDGNGALTKVAAIKKARTS